MGFMNLFKHFLGKDWGVHPADHKRPASDVPTRKLPIPPRLHLMLSQHVGAPSRPIVLVGEKVRKGQLIAAAQGNISAPLHASTSGTISAIGEITAPHASGLPGMAISIDSDGEDAWVETEVITNPFSALARGHRQTCRRRRCGRPGGRHLPVLGQTQSRPSLENRHR